MSPTFDPRDDLACCDGLETVTLSSPGGESATEVTGALRRRAERHEAEPSDGKYAAAEVTWHLPAAQLAAEPQIGATVTDAASVSYVVLSVERASLGGRWVCRSRALIVGGYLDQRITVQQATWTKSPDGVQVPTWHDVYANLPARIQPLRGDIEMEYDRRLTRVTHKIFVAQQFVIDHTFRVRAGEELYRVLGFEQPQRIDVAPAILVAQVSGATV